MDRLRQQMAKPNMMANCYLEFQKNTQRMNFTILTDFSSCIQDDNSLAISLKLHTILSHPSLSNSILKFTHPNSNSYSAIKTAERGNSYTKFTASDIERLTLPVLIMSQLVIWCSCRHCNRCYSLPLLIYWPKGRNYIAISLLDLLRDMEGYSKETS